MTKDMGLLGAGGQADEITSYLGPDYRVVFKAVSQEFIKDREEGLIDIEKGTSHEGYEVLVAVGSPKLKKFMVDKWQYGRYVTFVSDRAVMTGTVGVGKGTIIAPGAVITTNVIIGEHVLINIGATISHDCIVGDYVTISPGAHIAGKVKIGEGCFIGIGAAISNGVTIASGVVIGAGAVVLHDIEEQNAVYAGVPAKKIGQNEGWFEAI